jgi:hypothetical protein
MKNLILLIIFVLPMALFSASPSCGAGIEVSIIDAKGKVIKKGKLNKQGKLTLSGVKDASWDVKLTNNGKSIVLGVNKTKGGIDKATPVLYKTNLSDYQDGDDLLLRKRPGRTSTKIDGGTSGRPTGKRGASTESNINTSRTNKKSGKIDVDDDDDMVDTEMAHDGMDQDCDGADISVTSKVDKFGVSSITIMIRNK